MAKRDEDVPALEPLTKPSAGVRQGRLPESALACRFLGPGAPLPAGELALATIVYGASSVEPSREPGIRVAVPLAPLGEPLRETWTVRTRPAVHDDGRMRLAGTDDLAFGALTADEVELEADVGRMYDHLLAALARSRWPHLLRLWNVVPRVGEVSSTGSGAIDRYMRFCRARSLAFERHHGAGFPSHLCAASAVGSDGGPLVVYFLAGREPGERLSNPRQEEPWRYPPRYGPRAPSFARALRAPAPYADTTLLSGTASIVGHASLHDGDVLAQVDETVRNLEVVARAADATARGAWTLKTYLRDPRDLPRVRERLQAAFGTETPLLFVRADVCRPELAVEIEGLVRHA